MDFHTPTRMRKTVNGNEQAALDVFVVCDKLLPYLTKVKVDEKREHTLTRFKSVKKISRVTESDHS